MSYWTEIQISTVQKCTRTTRPPAPRCSLLSVSLSHSLQVAVSPLSWMGDTSEEDLEQEAPDEALMLIKYAAKEFINSDTNDNAIETEDHDTNLNKNVAGSLLLSEKEPKENLEADDKEVEDIFKDQEAAKKVSAGQVGTKRKPTLDHWEVAKEAQVKRRPIQSHWRQISTGEWVEVGAQLTGYKLKKEGGFCRLREGHHFISNREAMLSYCRSDITNTALHCTALHCTALLHYCTTALHCTALNYCTTTLHTCVSILL